MALKYGKEPSKREIGKFKRSTTAAKTAAKPDRTKVHVPGSFNEEQAAFIFSAFVAELQNRSIAKISGISIYFEAYDRHGNRVIFTDKEGRPTDTLPLRMPSPVQREARKAFSR